MSERRVACWEKGGGHRDGWAGNMRHNDLGRIGRMGG